MSDTYQLMEHLKEELSKSRREALNANLLLIETQKALAQVKQERDESRSRRDELLGAKTKPEPSRLEIAAMLLAGVWPNVRGAYTKELGDAYHAAECLIALHQREARKEVAK